MDNTARDAMACDLAARIEEVEGRLRRELAQASQMDDSTERTLRVERYADVIRDWLEEPRNV